MNNQSVNSIYGVRRINSKRRRNIKRNLLNEQNNECKYCRCTLRFDTATLDHIIPVSKGGTNAVKNLVVACKKCNQEKKDTWR